MRNLFLILLSLTQLGALSAAYANRCVFADVYSPPLPQTFTHLSLPSGPVLSGPQFKAPYGSLFDYQNRAAYNWLGAHEIWLHLTLGRPGYLSWIFMTQDGALFLWDPRDTQGSLASNPGTRTTSAIPYSRFYARVDPLYYYFCDLLVSNQSLPTPPQFTRNLTTYSSANAFLNWLGIGEEWIQDTQMNTQGTFWYFVAPGGYVFAWNPMDQKGAFMSSPHSSVLVGDACQ